MGLFDKKFCDICGEKIGLLGNRKLDDGNLCKDCAAKLSPWFSERKSSTVEDIRGQLEYREANREAVEEFSATASYGQVKKLLLDQNHGKFMVASGSNYRGENPDVLDFSQVTGCDVQVKESKSEQKTKDAQGHSVSYNPPRYTYSYDFYCTISVNHPYFNEMEFKLNDDSVEIDPYTTTTYSNPGMAARPGAVTPPRPGFPGAAARPGAATPPRPGYPGAAARPGAATPPRPGYPGAAARPGAATPPRPGYPGAAARPGAATPPRPGFPGAAARPGTGVSQTVTRQDPQTLAQNNTQYQNYVALGEEIKAALLQIRAENDAARAEADAPKTKVICPYCGASTIPDEYGACEYCGGAL